MLDALFRDLAFGWRFIRRDPAFAIVSILTLGIGIGANAAIFSFFDAVLLKPLPYKDPEQLVFVWEKPPTAERNGVSGPNFLDWRRDAGSFSHLAAQRGGGLTLTGSGDPVQLRGSRVSASYFDLFGIQAAIGRTFRPGEDEQGRDNVVVLADRLWRSQFGSDPNIVGKRLILNGEAHEVVGVLPADTAFDRGFSQIWKPLVIEPNAARDFHNLRVYGRMKPGVSIEQARAEMKAIAGRIATEYPAAKKGWSATVDRMMERIVGPQLRQSLTVMMLSVAAVLLIGCANLANLSLARGAERSRELAIRASMGASRWRLAQQFLTESLLLSMIGGVLGLAVGYGMVAWLNSALPEFALPSEVKVAMDWRVLLFTLGLCVTTTVLFGLAPALQASRPDLAHSLKEGSRGSGTGVRRRHFRNALVVGEVALAFVLLVSSGLLIRSFAAMQSVDLGIRMTNVIAAYLPVEERFVPDGPRMVAYHRQILERLGAIPGVDVVAETSALPMEGWSIGMPYRVARESTQKVDRLAAYWKIVSPSYFDALGIQLVKGRYLQESDVEGSQPVIVINETFAKKHFEKVDPIGQVVFVEKLIPGKSQLGPEVGWQVVGVVKDEMVNNVTDEASRGMYVTHGQSPVGSVMLVVRSSLAMGPLTTALRAAIKEVNKDQPVTRIRTLETIRDESLSPARLMATLLTMFSTVALVLAAVGIYGVISYSVAQRTHEIGVRAALGASGGDLLRMVVGGGMVTAIFGLAIGGIGAWAASKMIKSLLFNTSATDVVTFLAVLGTLLLVAFLACWIPGRRATRIDPMIALRYE
jgi:putative ABC transport system permease protein